MGALFFHAIVYTDILDRMDFTRRYIVSSASETVITTILPGTMHTVCLNYMSRP